MSDWGKKCLGDLLDRPLAYGVLKPGPYEEGGTPLIRIQDHKGGVIAEDSLHRIPASLHQEFKRTELREGDIIISVVGTIGRTAIVPKQLGGANVSRAFAVIGCSSEVDTQYLDQYLKSSIAQAWFKEQCQGNAQQVLNLGTLREHEVPLPPLPEQKKIAEILSGIDQAIAKLIHKSQKLDALQASLTEEFVQELQGRMDLTELREHAEVRTGVAKNAKSEGDMAEMPYMRVANVQDGYLDLSEIKTISIDRGRIQRYLLQPGDVLVNEGGDLDKVGRGVIWRGEIKECLHQNHVFAVRCSGRLTPEFLSLLLKSAYSKNYFLGCAKQTTNLASINSTQLKQFPIPVPDLRNQEEFIRNITAVKELNSAITREISGLEATKKAVASELLSGRKRVSV